MNDDSDDLDDDFDFEEPADLDATGLLEALVRQGRRTHVLLATRLVPALERIAAALEAAPRAAAGSGPAPARGEVDDLRARILLRALRGLIPAWPTR